MRTFHHIAPFRFELLLLVLLVPLPASAGQVGASLAQALPEGAALPEGIEATGDTVEVRSLTKWAAEHEQTVPEQAEQVARRALAIARGLDDQRGIGESLMILGEFASDLLQEEAYYREAQEIFAQIGFEQGLNYSRLAMGSVYRRRGELEQALTFYFGALEGFERLGDTEGQAAVLNSIGVAHKGQDNLQEAVTYYEQAATLAETLDNPPLLATILVNLGAVLARQGSYERAETIYRRALVISEEEGLRVYIAAISNNLGSIYSEQGRYEQALQPLLTARRLNEELDRIEGLIPVYDELGKAYMGLGEYDRALYYAGESLRLARETGLLSRQMEAYATLSDIYQAAGDPAQALVHYRQYVATKDSVFTTEKAEIITEMQTRYETEEKQRAIERLEQENQIQSLQAGRRQTLLLGGLGGLLLVLGFLFSRYRLKQKANRLLERQKEEILQQKKEKEILLQEIHHRVKNNLQVIAGLLGIQAKEARDEDALATLREAQGRVQAITLLHQKLYREENLTQVNIQEYMEELSAYLARTFYADDVVCRIQADGVWLDVDTAVPLGLITNELVSNAFEHAFPDKEGGEVRVLLRKDRENAYELEVSDNGIGFTPERSRHDETVGMKLVESLTRQLRGRLHIENGQGVTVRIHFEQANSVT